MLIKGSPSALAIVHTASLSARWAPSRRGDYSLCVRVPDLRRGGHCGTVEYDTIRSAAAGTSSERAGQ